MEQERRTHVTIELRAKRLGLYLEPADPDGRGAILRRFEPMDQQGTPGEAQIQGVAKVGMCITQINDSTVSWTPFAMIISTLVNSSRPLRITFRDPEVAEFRDAYGFLRTKMHVERETAYLTKTAAVAEANDKAWLAFLSELGGKRGASWGVQRVMRDAVGDITFVADPAIRLNAVSPIHGRIIGMSSNSSGGGSSGAAGNSSVSSPPSTPTREGRGTSADATNGAGAGIANATPPSSRNTTTNNNNNNSDKPNTHAGTTQLHVLNTSSSPAYARPVNSNANIVPPSPLRNIAGAGGGRGGDDSGTGHADGNDGPALSSPPSSPEADDNDDVDQRASSTSTQLFAHNNNNNNMSAKETPAQAAAAAAARAAVVVSIYKRCWSAASIGVAVPPGLSVVLPGELPKPKQREKWQETLTRLITQKGGIPAAFRPSIWWEVSGAHAKCSLHPPGYYASLCKQIPCNESRYAIDKDIDRTFPGHPFFEKKAGSESLRRVLSAFSVHNPDIGYCQSINFLAGFLLLLLPEEQAFWILECFVNEILPPEYYTPSLIGVHADQRVLGHLVGEMLPDVAAAYEGVGVMLHIVTVEWFMCAFVTLMPCHTCLRVWDAIFIHGAEALFRIALVLFAQHKDRILSVTQSATRSGVLVSSDGKGGGANGNTDVVVVSSNPVDKQQNGNKNDSSGSNGGGGDKNGRNSLGRTSTSSGWGLGRARDTVAETAAKVLAAAAASGVNFDAQTSPNSNGDAGSSSNNNNNSNNNINANNDDSSKSLTSSSSSSSPSNTETQSTNEQKQQQMTPSSPSASSPRSSAPLARGGTVRSPFSCFPSLFSMLKNMPCGCHDADELMRLAFPQSPKDAKESLPWNYTAPIRLGKLRAAARSAAEVEMAEADGMRQGVSSNNSNSSAGAGSSSSGSGKSVAVIAAAVEALARGGSVDDAVSEIEANVAV